MTLVVEMTLQRENSKIGLHWMHGVKKLNFMRPDPVMPSHLRSPSRPFLKCQIAKRYTQAQIQISVTAGVRGGISGAWPDAEDEQQESEAEECEAEYRGAAKGSADDRLLPGGLGRRVC